MIILIILNALILLKSVIHVILKDVYYVKTIIYLLMIISMNVYQKILLKINFITQKTILLTIHVKIVNISANNKECYAIGKDGNLYENKGNNFKKILPPLNTKKFLQCALGDKYIICLINSL